MIRENGKEFLNYSHSDGSAVLDLFGYKEIYSPISLSLNGANYAKSCSTESHLPIPERKGAEVRQCPNPSQEPRNLKLGIGKPTPSKSLLPRYVRTVKGPEFAIFRSLLTNAKLRF
jgi:hypothetical protein